MSIVPQEVVQDIRETWPARDMPLLEYAIERVAEWALEMAAKACEDQGTWLMDDPGETAARVIRAMISPTGKIKGGESDEREGNDNAG